MKIPPSFIEDIKARVDLADLIGERLPLKRAGTALLGRCPFHNEKTPSFSVNPGKQFFHCFGCGAHGDAVQWLMDYDRMSFREAIEHLAALLGTEIPRDFNPEPGIDPEHSIPKILEIQDQAARWYRTQLREASAAIEYLRAREITAESAQRYRIGYAPEGWRNLPGDWHRETLIHAGLQATKENREPYDRFRARLMFPIRDLRGRVLGFSGRVLGTGEPKYLNSPETRVFQKGRLVYGLFEALQAAPRPPFMLVVEGNLDAIMLAQHGLGNAVATLGTAPSTDHAALLFRYTPELVFAFDGDAAGQRAAWRAVEAVAPVLRDGRSVRFLTLPDGQDPDSLMRQEGPDCFRERIEGAVSLSDFVFQQLATQVNLQRLEGRAALIAAAKPLIEKMPAGNFRDLMVVRLREYSAPSWDIYRGAARPRLRVMETIDMQGMA